VASLKLSRLPKTWLFDIDGVLFKHWKNNQPIEREVALPGVKRMMKNISKEDRVILLSARKKRFRSVTAKALKHNGIRYDLLIMEVPFGERILINDKKPDGLITAYAINVKRDIGLSDIRIKLDGKQ
jgi:FMN phosphatase YigB (HAD superfamily)